MLLGQGLCVRAKFLLLLLCVAATPLARTALAANDDDVSDLIAAAGKLSKADQEKMQGEQLTISDDRSHHSLDGLAQMGALPSCRPATASGRR
jgi:hypothetical protein